MAARLFVLIYLAVRAVAQTVEGSVFDASTGNGIAGVKVELLRSTTPFYETLTDGGGRFRFDNIAANEYSIRYQSPDYWLTAGPTDYRPFPVGGEEPVKLAIRMMPWSKISGRVVDAGGNAVANARLELSGSGMLANGRTYLRTSWGGGGGGALADVPMTMLHSGKSDGQGRFEVRVMPGSYGLCAYPPANLKPPVQEKDGPALVWVSTCYPGVPADEAAPKLVVLPGGEVSGVELKLPAAPTHTVRGVVLNRDGTPAPGVSVSLVPSLEPTSVKARADGTFEISSLTEGEWGLLAEGERGPQKLRGTRWVEVAKHDLEGVKLRLVPPVAIRGKVMVDGLQKDAPMPKFGAIILAEGGSRSQGRGIPGLAAPIETDPGSAAQEVFPGVYRLFPMFQAVPPPYYLDSLQLGDADLRTSEVEVSSDAVITAVYKSDGGSVTGRVENCRLGGVLLIPGDPGLQGRGFSRSGACDAGDHYQVQGVRPGEYYAVAFGGNGTVPAVNEALLRQGVKVTVRAGTGSTVDLRALTQPIFQAR